MFPVPKCAFGFGQKKKGSEKLQKIFDLSWYSTNPPPLVKSLPALFKMNMSIIYTTAGLEHDNNNNCTYNKPFAKGYKAPGIITAMSGT